MKASVIWVEFVLASYLPPLFPLFSPPSLSVGISYSSTSWHEHSGHTEMIEGWREIERKKSKKKAEREAGGGRQVHKDEGVGQSEGDGTG